MKPQRKSRILATTVVTFFILLAGWPAQTEGQYIPRRFKRGPVVDIADVPLNRVLPDYQWDSHERQFFPSLLGLHSPGARAIRTKYFAIYYTQAEGETGPVSRSGLGKQQLSTPDSRFTVDLPVRGSGQDTVTISLIYYYCQQLDQGICKVGSVVFTVPLEIGENGKPGPVVLKHKVAP